MHLESNKDVPLLRFKDDEGKDFLRWKTKSLGAISEVKRGASPRPITSQKWFSEDSQIGWVRISDVTKSKKFLKKTTQYLSEEGVKKSRLIPKGSMVMSICATIGKPIYIDFDVCIHDGFVVFDNLDIDKEYLYYFLEKIQKRWYRYGQPGTQVNLNTSIVSNERIQIPETDEQHKIANFLSSVDTRIAQLEKKKSLLEQYKKGLMQKLFSQEIRFKNDEGEEYPEWEERRIKDVCQIIGGAVFRRGEITTLPESGRIPVLRAGNIGDVLNLHSDLIWLKLKDISNRQRLKYLDIVICMSSGSKFLVGKNAQLRQHWIGTVGAFCSIIRTNPTRCNPIFLANTLEAQKFRRWTQLAYGSNIKNLNRTELANYQFLLPSLQEQQEFVSFLSSVDGKIELIEEQINKNREFKKGLLQQMFV